MFGNAGMKHSCRSGKAGVLRICLLDWCDAVLFLFDGRVPDEGACFELGYCYAKGKRCIGYKTDARSFIDGFDNVMLCGASEVVLRNEDELREYMLRLKTEGPLV